MEILQAGGQKESSEGGEIIRGFAEYTFENSPSMGLTGKGAKESRLRGDRLKRGVGAGGAVGPGPQESSVGLKRSWEEKRLLSHWSSRATVTWGLWGACR